MRSYRFWPNRNVILDAQQSTHSSVSSCQDEKAKKKKLITFQWVVYSARMFLSHTSASDMRHLNYYTYDCRSVFNIYCAKRKHIKWMENMTWNLSVPMCIFLGSARSKTNIVHNKFLDKCAHLFDWIYIYHRVNVKHNSLGLGKLKQKNMRN